MAFNIPFNSTELQKFAGGASRKVTIHLDPDDLRTAFATTQGHSEVIKLNLSMTAFTDLTLEEAINLMEQTSRRNPEAQAIHDAHLKEIRERRARESGFFPDTRDPSNFLNTNDLRRRAERLAQVSIRPQGATGPTARAGRITDRSSSTPAFKVGSRSAEAVPTSLSTDLNPKITGKTFTPIKDSKL